MLSHAPPEQFGPSRAAGQIVVSCWARGLEDVYVTLFCFISLDVGQACSQDLHLEARDGPVLLQVAAHAPGGLPAVLLEPALHAFGCLPHIAPAVGGDEAVHQMIGWSRGPESAREQKPVTCLMQQHPTPHLQCPLVSCGAFCGAQHPALPVAWRGTAFCCAAVCVELDFDLAQEPAHRLQGFGGRMSTSAEASDDSQEIQSTGGPRSSQMQKRSAQKRDIRQRSPGSDAEEGSGKGERHNAQ